MPVTFQIPLRCDIKYYDFYSGSGSLSYALKKLKPKAKCLGFAEAEFKNVQVYNKNFSGTGYYGDPSDIDLHKLKKHPDFIFFGRPFRKRGVHPFGSVDGICVLDIQFFRFVSDAIRILKPKHFLVDGPHHYNMTKVATLSKMIPECEILSAFTSSVSAVKRTKLIWSNLELNEPAQEAGHVFKRNGIPAHNWSKSRRSEGRHKKLPTKHIHERIAINGLVNNIMPVPTASEAVTFFPDEKIDLLLNPDLCRAVDKIRDSFFYKLKREWVITADEGEIAMGLPHGWTTPHEDRRRLAILGQTTPVQFWEKLLKPHI